MEDETVILRQKLSWYEKRYGPYIEKRGIHNFQNLFRKPTLMEWTILFMTFMALFIAWAYQTDIAACQETVTNLDAICRDLYSVEEVLNNTNVSFPTIKEGILNGKR